MIKKFCLNEIDELCGVSNCEWKSFVGSLFTEQNFGAKNFSNLQKRNFLWSMPSASNILFVRKRKFSNPGCRKRNQIYGLIFNSVCRKRWWCLLWSFLFECLNKKTRDAVFCPGVVRPGIVLEKFVLELSGPKKKIRNSFVINWTVFQRKFLSWKCPRVFCLWEEIAWIWGFWGRFTKFFFALDMSWTKSFRTIPRRTAPEQKFVPPPKRLSWMIPFFNLCYSNFGNQFYSGKCYGNSKNL